MRIRDLFAIALSGLVTWYVVQMSQSRLDVVVPFSQQVNRTEASRNNAIGLDSKIWSTFQIPDQSAAIRLLTNAAVRNPKTPVVTQSDPRSGWRYAIEYQLTDLKGNILDQSEYHFRSRVEPMIDIASGQPVYPMFFEDSSIATQTRVMQIGLSHFADRRPAMIRVRFKSSDPNIKGVVARVLSQLERPDADERSTWNRLSRQRRDEICKYCVYDSDLLGLDERSSLLRWHWVNSPTLGEFESRPLYSRNDLDEEAIGQPLLPAGKYTAENWISSIAVPTGAGDVRLQFISTDDQPLNDISAQIHWYGDHPEQRLEAISESSTFVLSDIDGGLIQIRPDDECVIRAYWKPANNNHGQQVQNWISENQPTELGEYEITPKPLTVRTYLVNESQVEYSISHLSNQPTPFQLSVRQIFDNEFFAQTTPTSDAPKWLWWEFLNQSNEVIDSGEIEVTNRITRYEHLTIAGKRILLSDPQSAYFAIPNMVNTVRIGSHDHPLLVNGYVRPSGLIRKTRVPDDYQPFGRGDRRTRSWYGLNPNDHESLFQNNRSFIVNTQPVAPEIDPQILLGRYDWRRFEPQGNWIGREILIPIDRLPEREESQRSIYYEIECDRNWDASHYQMQPKPRRVSFIVAADEAPGMVTIKVDNKVVYRKRHASKRGLIVLPMPIFVSALDDMQLTVTSERPCRLFVGGIQVDDAPKFVKRLAQRFGQPKLEFEYDKETHAKELLTMKLFRGRKSNLNRCKIRVRIIPDQPLDRSSKPVDGWTLINRVYDLTPNRELDSLLVDTDAHVDEGYRCFITLDTDLSPGKYKIDIQCLDSENDAYVLLYRTVPGKKPIHRIHTVPHSIRRLAEPISAATTQKADPTGAFTDAGNPASSLIVPLDQPQTVEHELLENESLDNALIELLKSKPNTQYVEPTDDDGFAGLEELFKEIATTRTVSEELNIRGNALGWKLTELADHGIVVITEDTGQRRGRGMYVVRRDSQSNTIIQAPHRFFDKRTGVIARKLFAENDVYAAAWNSSHRKQIDVAHEQKHHFNAFMNALTDRDTKIIQLHGFESESRSGSIQSTDIILSDSTRFPARFAMQTAIRLKELLGKKAVRLFPIDVNELGGTKNSQAALLRNAGFHRFLHVELDTDYRNQLVISASKRAEFAKALLDSSANPYKQPKP